MRRSVAEQALYLRRPPYAPSRVRAQSQVEPGIRCRSSSRPGRAGRRILISVSSWIERRMVINPISSRSLPVRKLAGLHLADDDGSGINEPLHRHRVRGLGRVESIHGPVAVACLNACNVINIFDPKSDTCKWLRCCLSVVETRWYADGGRLDTRQRCRQSRERSVGTGNEWLSEGSGEIDIQTVRLEKRSPRREEIRTIGRCRASRCERKDHARCV